jgi:hypothetical protein
LKNRPNRKKAKAEVGGDKIFATARRLTEVLPELLTFPTPEEAGMVLATALLKVLGYAKDPEKAGERFWAIMNGMADYERKTYPLVTAYRADPENPEFAWVAASKAAADASERAAKVAADAARNN